MLMIAHKLMILAHTRLMGNRFYSTQKRSMELNKRKGNSKKLVPIHFPGLYQRMNRHELHAKWGKNQDKGPPP
jgi:hypothetical protein